MPVQKTKGGWTTVCHSISKKVIIIPIQKWSSITMVIVSNKIVSCFFAQVLFQNTFNATLYDQMALIFSLINFSLLFSFFYFESEGGSERQKNILSLSIT
jgi:hypothetical protein